jgi:predicted RecA/RadA family phage recombinase
MKNYSQKGDVLSFTAPSGGVVSGGVYKVGNIVGVAAADAAQNDPFELQVVGVFAGVPKTTSQSWAEGAVLYWDDSGKKFTSTASGNTLAGCAAAAAGSSDTTGTVRLNGIAKGAES